MTAAKTPQDAEDLLLETGNCVEAWSVLASVWARDPLLADDFANGRDTLDPPASRRDSRLTRVVEASLRRNPRSAPAWAWRGALRRRLRDYAGAVSDLERAWTLGLRTAALLTWRGEARIQSLDYDNGLADMKAALRRPDAAAWNWVWCGRCLFQLLKDPAGLKYLDRGVVLAPGWAKAYAWRGEARRHLGDLNGMLADFDRALSLGPGHALRQLVLGLRAMGLLQLGRTKEAVRELKRVRRTMPGHGLWAYGLALAARKRRRLREWLDLLDQAARLEPKYEKGVEATPEQEREDLLRDLDALVAAEPRNSAARRWRGRTLLAQGRAEEAEADFKVVCRAEPLNASAWLRHSETLMRQPGRLPDALKSFRRAAGLDRRSSEIPLARARLALAVGDAPAALASYARALKMDPRCAPANAEFGAVLLSLDRHRQALPYLAIASKISRRDLFPLVDLSVARRRAGDVRGAREAWGRAVGIDSARARRRLQVWDSGARL